MDSFDKKVGVGIVTVLVILIGLFLFIPRIQNPSDCTSSQKYDQSAKQCREKTSKVVKEEDEIKRTELLAKEIQKKKKMNGELCISSVEAWFYAGSGNYCVVFHPGWFYDTGYGLMFINEKRNYKDGFVAPLMKYYMISWEELLARYRIDKIAVTGELVWYDGHPEIKVYDLSQITIPKIYSCETAEGCVYTKS